VLATVLALVALGHHGGRGLGRLVGQPAGAPPAGQVADAAGQHRSGDVTARVARDRDPDLDSWPWRSTGWSTRCRPARRPTAGFAADVSHELRSPLQTLSAATSVLLRRKDGLDDRAAAAVELLDAEVQRFESLVTDLLELARADRPAERRPTDVVALARALVASRGLPAGVLVAHEGPLEGDVDPRRFEQVLANLVDNAAKHGGGVVRIGLDVEPARIVLEVDDEGAGVPRTSASWCSTASPAAGPPACAAAARAPGSAWPWSPSTCTPTPGRWRRWTARAAAPASGWCCPAGRGPLPPSRPGRPGPPSGPPQSRQPRCRHERPSAHPASPVRHPAYDPAQHPAHHPCDDRGRRGGGSRGADRLRRAGRRRATGP
jgi:hypothetical protein